MSRLLEQNRSTRILTLHAGLTNYGSDSDDDTKYSTAVASSSTLSSTSQVNTLLVLSYTRPLNNVCFLAFELNQFAPRP